MPESWKSLQLNNSNLETWKPWNLRIPRQKNEKDENLTNPLHNNENHEILRISCEVSICTNDLASSSLPEHGVPEHITACALEVDGSENALVKLEGPASRIADAGKRQKPETTQILPNLSRTLLRFPLPLMTAPLTYLSCPSLSILFTTSNPWR